MPGETVNVVFGARVDETGFNRFDELIKKARQHKKIEVDAGLNIATEDFDRYDALIEKSRKIDKISTKAGLNIAENDFADYKRKVDFAGQRKIKVDAGLDIDQRDFVLAAAEYEALRKKKDIKWNVKLGVDQSAFSRFRQETQSATKDTSTFTGVISEAASSLTGYSGMTPALGITAIALPIVAGLISALTAGIGALVAGLAPLVGILATLPQAFMAVGAIAATVALAFKGVGEAMKEVKGGTSDLSTAQSQLVTAQKGVTSSSQQIITSQQSEQQAQESLTLARLSATRQLQDMKLATQEAALTEKQSKLAITIAEEQLQAVRQDPTASLEQVQQAELAVTQAKLASKSATEQNTRAQQDYNTAKKEGIKGMPAVVAAEKAVAQAQQQMVTATTANTNAQKKLLVAQNNVTQAQKEATPQQVAFAKVLQSLSPLLEQLRQTASKTLLPGISEGLKSITKNFSVFKGIIGSTGTVLGNFARDAGRMLGSASWGSALDSLGKSNAKTLTSLADAALHFMDALKNIAVAAEPLTEFLGKLIDQWSKAFDAFTGSAEGAQKMATFFQDTETAIKQVSSILGNVFTTISNILQAGYGSGKGLLSWIKNITSAWADWTGSAKGQDSISSWFKKNIPTFKELLKVIADIIKAFFALSNSGAITSLLKVVDQLLPGIVSSLSGIASVVGWFSKLLDKHPALSKFLGTVIGLTLALKALGVVGKLFSPLLTIGKFFAPLLKNIGETILGWLGIGAAADKAKISEEAATGIPPQQPGYYPGRQMPGDPMPGGGKWPSPGGTIEEGSGLATSEAGGFLPATGAGVALTGGLVLANAATYGSIGASIASGKPQGVVKVASNLESSLGYGPKQQAEVRKFLSSIPKEIGSALSSAGKTIGSFISSIPGKIGSGLSSLGKFFAKIPDALGTAISHVPELLGKLVGFFVFLPIRIPIFFFKMAKKVIPIFVDLVKDIGGKMIDLGKDLKDLAVKAMGKLLNGIGNGAVAIFNWFKSFPGKALNFIKNLPNLLSNIGKTVISGGQSLLSGIKTGAIDLFNWLKDLPGKIISAIGSLASNIFHAGTKFASQFLKGFMSMVPGPLKDAIGTITGGISSGVSTITSAFAEGGKTQGSKGAYYAKVNEDPAGEWIVPRTTKYRARAHGLLNAAAIDMGGSPPFPGRQSAFRFGGLTADQNTLKSIKNKEKARTNDENQYSIADRKANLDGTYSAAELENLRSIKMREHTTMQAERALLNKLIPTLKQGIAYDKAQIPQLRNQKGKSVELQNTIDELSKFRDIWSEAAGYAQAIGMDISNNDIDQEDLTNQINQMQLESEVNTEYDQTIKDLTLQLSFDALTPDTADDTRDNALLTTAMKGRESVLAARYNTAKAIGNTQLADILYDALLSANQDLASQMGTDSAPVNPATDLANYVAARYDVMKTFGSNVNGPMNAALPSTVSPAAVSSGGTVTNNIQFDVHSPTSVQEPYLMIQRSQGLLRNFNR